MTRGPVVHRRSNKVEPMCGGDGLLVVGDALSFHANEVTCPRCKEIGDGTKPVYHPFVKDCPKPASFNGNPVCGCGPLPTSVPIPPIKGEMFSEVTLKSIGDDGLKRLVQDLREQLDAEKFAERLVEGCRRMLGNPEAVPVVLEMVKLRDQAFFGATVHSCPGCGCAWFEKPGDHAAKRCSCCAVMEAAKDQLVKIDGIVDKAGCKLSPMARKTVIDGVQHMATVLDEGRAKYRTLEDENAQLREELARRA